MTAAGQRSMPGAEIRHVPGFGWPLTIAAASAEEGPARLGDALAAVGLTVIGNQRAPARDDLVAIWTAWRSLPELSAYTGLDSPAILLVAQQRQQLHRGGSVMRWLGLAKLDERPALGWIMAREPVTTTDAWLGDADAAASTWSALINAGGGPLGASTFEYLGPTRR